MRRTTSVRSTKSAVGPTQLNMQQQHLLHQFPGCSHLVGNEMEDDSVKIMESIDGPITTEARPHVQSLHEEQTPVDHDANSCTHAHFLAQQFSRTYQQKAEDAMQDMMTKSIQVVTKTAASAGATMAAATTGGGTTCSSTMNYHQQQILEANLLQQGDPNRSSISQNLSSPTRTTKMMMNKYGESYFNNALLRRVDTSSPGSPILVHPKASPDGAPATITIGEEFSILGADDDEDENNTVNILSPAEHTDVDVQPENQAELEQNVDSNILKIHRPKPSLAKTLINYNPAPNISVTGADSLRASNSSILSTGRNISQAKDNENHHGKSNDK
ncbi:unnamed protein product, partial [Amoebophrya sp. A120]|eukprot:GSA120T00014152001.1